MSYLEGRVWPGERVTLVSETDQFACTATPISGRFKLRVPAGRYQVFQGKHLSCEVLVPEGEGTFAVASVALSKPVELPLLCAIPFCRGDLRATLDLLDWMRELGGCKRNPALLVADCKLPEADVAEVADLSRTVFHEIEIIRTPHALPDESWPTGPNWMFETAVRHVAEHLHRPFWWNEPDCIPLREGWLEALQEEYYKVGAPFMGCIVPEAEALCPTHLTGCAVYPGNAIRFVRHTFPNSGGTLAWDVACHSQVLPFTHHTRLFMNRYGAFNNPPTFTSLAGIRPDAVVCHRSKDGSLIKLLRKRRQAQ